MSLHTPLYVAGEWHHSIWSCRRSCGSPKKFQFICMDVYVCNAMCLRMMLYRIFQYISLYIAGQAVSAVWSAHPMCKWSELTMSSHHEGRQRASWSDDMVGSLHLYIG